MLENDVDFLEDSADYKPTPVQNRIKGKSIEAWFYKKFPGTMQVKRIILIMIAIILFGLSIVFVLLSYMNTREPDIRQDINERIQNTQLN